MCIFTGNITDVANTMIFTGLVYPNKIVKKYVGGEPRTYKSSAGNPLQLVIYSNKVHANNHAAMILPFPLLARQKNRFKILNMSNYKNIFEDLEMMFPTEELDFATFSMNFNKPDANKLEVQYVGNYQISVVPCLADFGKLQADKFNLDADVQDILGRYYKNNFGFVVCQLTQFARSNQYHPLAYVHEIRADKRLFIPTRHYHKTRNNNTYSKYYNPSEPSLTELRDAEKLDADDLNGFMYNTLMMEDKWININSRRRDINSYKEQESHDWDHDIYVLNLMRVVHNPLLKQPGVRVMQADKDKLSRFYSYIEADRLPVEINIPVPKQLYKIHIDKIYKYNCDLFL